jgi:hypothetical protein
MRPNRRGDASPPKAPGDRLWLAAPKRSVRMAILAILIFFLVMLVLNLFEFGRLD